jgi:hypothetical protein
MGFFLALVVILVVVAQACRLAERAAYRRGFRAELRAAADQADAVERISRPATPRRYGGWIDFPQRHR